MTEHSDMSFENTSFELDAKGEYVHTSNMDRCFQQGSCTISELPTNRSEYSVIDWKILVHDPCPNSLQKCISGEYA